MSAFLGHDRGRWVIAAVVATVFLGGFVFLFQPPVIDLSLKRSPAKAPVGLGLRRVAPAEAALVDPTPLFLPTIWNTAQKDVALPKAGGAFANYPAKFAYEEAEFKGLHARSIPVANAADLLALATPGASTLGIGRQSGGPDIQPARGAFLEVIPQTGGPAVLNATVPLLNLPAIGLWEPIEFLAVVDAAGLCGPLVSTVRSKAEDIDAYFKNYLTTSFRLGAKLEPGIYRIRVGP